MSPPREPVTTYPFSIMFKGTVYLVRWHEGGSQERWARSYRVCEVPGLVDGLVTFRPIAKRRYWPEGVWSELERTVIEVLEGMEAPRADNEVTERVRVVEGEAPERVRVVYVEGEEDAEHEAARAVLDAGRAARGSRGP